MENWREDLWRFLWGPEPLIRAQALIDERWQGIIELIGMAGYTHGFLIVIALTIWFGARRLGYYAIVASTVALAMCVAVWAIVPIDRPDYPNVRWGGPPLPGPSFPSGHAAMTLGFYAPFAVFSPWALAGVAALTLFIAASRLYLGVHYVGDVIGGLMVGLIVATFFRPIWTWALSWLCRIPWPVYMGVATLVAIGCVLWPLLGPSYQAEEAGLIGGGALGMGLEYRLLRVQRGPRDWARRLGVGVIGVGGIVLAIVGESLLQDVAPLAGFLVAMLGGFWAFFLASALFVRLGWVQPRRDEDEAAETTEQPVAA